MVYNPDPDPQIGSWAGCTGAWLMAGVPGQIVCNVATVIIIIIIIDPFHFRKCHFRHFLVASYFLTGTRLLWLHNEHASLFHGKLCLGNSSKIAVTILRFKITKSSTTWSC